MMKYLSQMICFQEVPGETTLSFSISNCHIHCPGCHSQYLWEDKGIPMLKALSEKLLEYQYLATCVLFMGGYGEDQREELRECLRLCKNQNYKTALYTGYDEVDEETLKLLNFVKVGPYIESRGGLDKKTTNQRMYKVVDGKLGEDITYKFWSKPDLTPKEL